MLRCLTMQWFTCSREQKPTMKSTYSSDFIILLRFILVTVIWIIGIHFVTHWSWKNWPTFSGTTATFMMRNIKKVHSFGGRMIPWKWRLINTSFVRMILNSQGPTTLVGGHNVHCALHSVSLKESITLLATKKTRYACS